MLPSFYQNMFDKYLTQAQIITLNLLVHLLQKTKQVKIERLAAELPIPIQYNSRRRHIQRFLKLPSMSVVLLWFSLIEIIICEQIKVGKELIIALDRTQWKDNNVLMASAIIQKRAFPVYWNLLAKEGATNLSEQQAILRPVMRLFKKYKLVIIGDREFCSVELADWLQSKQVSFVFRQKKDTTFREKRKKFQPLHTIKLNSGQKVLYTDISFTQKKGLGRFNLAVYLRRKYKGKQEKEPWYLLTNLSDLKKTIKIYSQRFGIEAMFKDCKTGGYNLEGSQASPDKLTRIILLIAIAMTAAWLLGKRIKLQKQQLYICRSKEKGRTRKRHSNFWIGLYGQNWINAFVECQEWIEKLMRLILNKRAFYQRGLNAMKLIKQAF